MKIKVRRTKIQIFLNFGEPRCVRRKITRIFVHFFLFFSFVCHHVRNGQEPSSDNSGVRGKGVRGRERGIEGLDDFFEANEKE